MSIKETILNLIKNEKVEECNKYLQQIGDKISLDGVDFSGLKLREINLSGSSLRNTNFTGCVLALADFSNCNLENTIFNEAGLFSAKFNSANLKGASFLNSKLQGVILDNAILIGSVFSAKTDFSGAKFSNTDLSERNFEECIFEGCIFKNTKIQNSNFSGANLRDITFFQSQLQNTNFSKSILKRAMINQVDLSQAILTECNLKETNLLATKMNGANLEYAGFEKSNIIGCEFKNANIKGARFLDTYIEGTNFNQSNLNETLLIRARFLRTNLEQATFEKAIVGDIYLSELTGFPLPPNELWEEPTGEKIIIGKDANEFFVLLAIVEVYLDKPLSFEEIGLYHVHLGVMQRWNVGDGVYLIGHWHDFGGSVLRFQGRSYLDIYKALPVFLAPFRKTKFINWKTTLSNLDENEQEEVFDSLMQITLSTGRKWEFAEKMADSFYNFYYAEVRKIKKGKGRGLIISVFSNPQIEESEERIKRENLLTPNHEQIIQVLMTGRNSSLQIIQQGEKSKMETNNLINSNVGNFNTGFQSNVQVITENISKMSDSGLDELARAFEEMTKATKESDEINEKEKGELLEQIKALTEQVNLPEGQKNIPVIKLVIRGLATSYAAFANSSSIWSLWGNVICSYFGVENPFKP